MVAMNVVTLDFETYFDVDYTLKKMTTEEYIRSPRFDPHGAGVRDPDGLLMWLRPNMIPSYLNGLPRPIAMLCHHAHFDGLILHHWFDWRPDAWLDTLSMGRVVFDGTVKLGLASLAEKLGLAAKSVPYDLFKGFHWHELSTDIQQQVANGAMHDCELTWQCCQAMLSGHPMVPYTFPLPELPVVDLTVRMFTEPSLVGDPQLLGKAWEDENASREELFARLGVRPEQLRQDETFADMLRELDIDPPRKTTGKGNEKYAFAKSDWAMQDLVTSGDPDVAMLAEARLKAQSSIYLSRTERIGWAASRGPLPVYLSYAAAHTRRWGGGDKTNYQNWPRSDPAQPRKGALRRAIKAP